MSFNIPARTNCVLYYPRQDWLRSLSSQAGRCPLLSQPGLNVLYYSSKDCPLSSQAGLCPTLMSAAFGHGLSVNVVLLQCNDHTWTWLISHWCALTRGKANSVFSLSLSTADMWVGLCANIFTIEKYSSITQSLSGWCLCYSVTTACCVLSLLNQGPDRWLHNTGCCVLHLH